MPPFQAEPTKARRPLKDAVRKTPGRVAHIPVCPLDIDCCSLARFLLGQHSSVGSNFQLPPVLVIIIAYLIGSIPFGYLIVRAKKGGDIRDTGSGGTGATNVSRSAGKTAGVVTLVLDAFKGVAAVVIARMVLGLSAFGVGVRMGGGLWVPLLNASMQSVHWWLAAAAIAVILGHIFPIWLGFRGGKGVATGVGVFLVLAPIAVALAAVVFMLIVWLTRYVSLGSIVAAATIPLFVLLQTVFIRPIPESAPLMTAAIASALLIAFAHRANIRRLIRGTESKFR
jgi:glycerol-3-phosphate acyltransferase PlsY